MWPLTVVMVDVDAEDMLEVAAVEDQEPVQALAADGANEPLRDCVRLRRAHWRPDDPHAFAAEDLIEGTAVLAVTVTDQEANAALAELEAEVARPLGHPLAGRIPRAAGEPDAAAGVRDEEEHVESAE